MIRPTLILAMFVFLAGCTPGQEDSSDIAVPAAVAFKGTVDPSLAGEWRTSDGHSVLKLMVDGSLQIQSTFATPNGKQTSTKQGKWLSTGEQLKLQYEESDGSFVTIAYGLKVDKDKIVLSTKSPKRDTSYTRK